MPEPPMYDVSDMYQDEEPEMVPPGTNPFQNADGIRRTMINELMKKMADLANEPSETSLTGILGQNKRMRDMMRGVVYVLSANAPAAADKDYARLTKMYNDSQAEYSKIYKLYHRLQEDMKSVGTFAYVSKLEKLRQRVKLLENHISQVHDSAPCQDDDEDECDEVG